MKMAGALRRHLHPCDGGVVCLNTRHTLTLGRTTVYRVRKIWGPGESVNVAGLRARLSRLDMVTWHAKKTWLYVYGIAEKDLPDLHWGHTPNGVAGFTISQWYGSTGLSVGKKISNATPLLFAEMLVDLAKGAKKKKKMRQAEMDPDWPQCYLDAIPLLHAKAPEVPTSRRRPSKYYKDVFCIVCAGTGERCQC